MADIPANHQTPEAFQPSRPGDDHEPAAIWTPEQWAEENAKALRAEAKAAKADAKADAGAPAGAPVNAGGEG